SAADDASGGTSRYDVREPDEVVTFTYAWLRASYRDSVHPGPERSIPTVPAPLTPGEQYDVGFSSLHTDYVVPAGHRLRFTVANQAGGTVASSTGGVVTLAVGDGGATITLPVAGAAAPAAPAPVAEPRPVTPPVPPAPPSPLPATGGLPAVALAVAGAVALMSGRARRRLA
ncbi:MAG TPA: CocE/NonD family hydrolase C-terminal non-catalytic domain-containing protein, partial [Mycobacteriales bacterium]|nr:CocE/NonD family hydrolase C-terminal non-catalytic domain-containing protein [Mycobacteriales bacterium]